MNQKLKNGFLLAIVIFTSCQINSNNGLENSRKRDRSHIEKTLHLDETLTKSIEDIKRTEKYINALKAIYKTAIQPVEEIYRLKDLNIPSMTENDITATPMLLFVGPWSTGKSSMINYIIGMEDIEHQLRSGAEPTTSDFTVIKGGPDYKTVEGLVLAADKNMGFSALETFGQGFLEKLQGIELPYPLLNKVMFVDTPGVIENRKQQERGYPFNSVMKWFMERADLIFVIFDPTKLDVGFELEMLFKQLKGHESQIRLILNKADSISTQELMRVYGTLFWGMAPLINVTEPPRVYIGSFWEQAFKAGTTFDLFLKEELSLLHDLHQVVRNQIENKIAFVRKHAILIRIHALVVDKYLNVFNRKKSIFGDQEALLASIIEDPNKYHIYQAILSSGDISKYDLPPIEKYKDFFSINALNSFNSLDKYCSYFSGCIMNNLVKAIKEDLPNLLKEFKTELYGTPICDSESDCENPEDDIAP